MVGYEGIIYGVVTPSLARQVRVGAANMVLPTPILGRVRYSGRKPSNETKMTGGVLFPQKDSHWPRSRCGKNEHSSAGVGAP